MDAHRIVLAAGVMAGIAGVCPAQTTYIETFDDGMNHTGWTWDRTGLGSVMATGGNPGGFFQSALQAVPNLFSSHELFTGDYRARAVGSIGGDLRTVQFSSRSGPISLILVHKAGTPDDVFDDSFAHFITEVDAPVTSAAGWVGFDVPIPFSAVDAPDGWVMTGILPSLPAPASWDTLITSVDEVIIGWGNSLLPQLAFDVVRGGDNLRITYNVPAPGAGAVLVLGLAGLAVRRRH